MTDRQLALRAIGRSVIRLFNEGNMDDAWLWEQWQQKVEKLTDKEFDEHYGITQTANIGS